ncbi:MAG: DoxX family protein [Bacteroidales bacterium]|nr:DoxX family protein [Bacteroidales bacterium]
MKFLRAISRLIIGLTFIFSGFVKIIDPVGAGLIVEEYFKWLGLGEWHFLFQTLGVVLSGTELLLGIAVLLGIRMKYACKVAFWFMAGFTVLTLILAIFNPITDCGCFGEALKLTNLETFLKNVVLMLFATILYFQRNKFIPVAPAAWEWGFAAVYALMIMGLSSYSYRHLPLIDFMEFKVGTNVASKLENVPLNTDEPQFETVLIYSKDGKNYEFSINDLPDSTFTFVDSHTKQMKGKGFLKPMDFAVSDINGIYVTDSLLAIKGPLFIISVPYMHKIGEKKAIRINRFINSLKSHNLPVAILTGSGWSETAKTIKEFGIEVNTYHTDFKTLLTFNRSNGGVVYFYDGIITKKWSSAGMPYKDIDSILNEDPELLAAKTRIREQLSAEIAAVIILLMIVIMRYVCRIVYIHKHSESEWIAETEKFNDDNGE